PTHLSTLSLHDALPIYRRHGVLYRVWPGTQRLLAWGDPAMVAAYSRAFGFAGSDGAELFEPLSFRGREGSGAVAGGRAAYADASDRKSTRLNSSHLVIS